jgi:hypothetical protein
LLIAVMPSSASPFAAALAAGAHHLSRKLQSLGHDARLMPAKYVRAYLSGRKSDFRDAEAIAETARRPTMRFVATKTTEQPDLRALRRVRERLVSQRTGIISQIRTFLLVERDRPEVGCGNVGRQFPAVAGAAGQGCAPEATPAAAAATPSSASPRPAQNSKSPSGTTLVHVSRCQIDGKFHICQYLSGTAARQRNSHGFCPYYKINQVIFAKESLGVTNGVTRRSGSEIHPAKGSVREIHLT